MNHWKIAMRYAIWWAVNQKRRRFVYGVKMKDGSWTYTHCPADHRSGFIRAEK